MALGIIANLDRAVDVHSAAAAYSSARGLLLPGPSVPVVVVLLQRRAAATRTRRH